MAIPKFRTPKSVLVTGGSSGIGKAIAIEAAKHGANVFLVAREPTKLDEAIAEVRRITGSGQVAGASASVTDANELRHAVELAQSQHGAIDLLVNSAGVSVPGYFDDLSIEQFADLIDVNYLGTVRAVQAVVPEMKANGYGWILNVSSVAGLKGFFGYTAYCGSKFAINGFSEALRSELERYRIGVTLLCPPDTQTPMLEAEEAYKPMETKRLSASGSILQPEDVAHAAWKSLQRSRLLVTPGWSAKFIRYGNRLVPGIIDWTARRTIRD